MIKSKIKITGTILSALAGILIVMQVKASGGEAMEGSQLEQFEKKERALFDGFAEMDYCLFLETNLDYGVSLNYDRYGIYGDFIQTTREGEELYFKLNEKIIGNKLELYTHTEWFDNSEPFIQDISPDLEWVISRQYTAMSMRADYTDKIYFQGQALEQKDGIEWSENALFGLQKQEGSEVYEQKEEEKVKRWKETIQTAQEWNDAFWKHWAKSVSAIDEYGKLLAVAAPDNKGIGIYSMESGEELRYIEIADSIDTDWPFEVSQIKGNAEGGWIVFSNGDVTYPDSSLEKLGEFMYGTTFSPDEKYIAYCTGNEVLRDLHLDWSDEGDTEKLEKWMQMYDRWETVGTGWYVEELETGKTTYIFIEPWKGDFGSTIRGGRCVWIQKDKLLRTLDS